MCIICIEIQKERSGLTVSEMMSNLEELRVTDSISEDHYQEVLEQIESFEREDYMSHYWGEEDTMRDYSRDNDYDSLWNNDELNWSDYSSGNYNEWD